MNVFKRQPENDERKIPDPPAEFSFCEIEKQPRHTHDKTVGKKGAQRSGQTCIPYPPGCCYIPG